MFIKDQQLKISCGCKVNAQFRGVSHTADRVGLGCVEEVHFKESFPRGRVPDMHPLLIVSRVGIDVLVPKYVGNRAFVMLGVGHGDGLAEVHAFGKGYVSLFPFDLFLSIVGN